MASVPASPSATASSAATWQASLFALGEPAVRADAPTERIELDATSWLDVTRGVLAGADEVCAELARSVGWRHHRRRMYDRVVDDPRVSRWFGADDEPPHPVLADVRAELTRRYGRPFGGPGLNHYRDGRDSVAFHRDRELRELDDALVAVLTLGARRPFLVRPHGGGRSIDLSPASGDLIVMGGRCQLDWEHGVPKVARSGTRISVSWRWSSRHGAHTTDPGRDRGVVGTVQQRSAAHRASDDDAEGHRATGEVGERS